ncbi:MAG: MCE family protein [Planctomycetes bacterium]|nr:MCE family protein [Planctomycetota bacterium]MCP4861525.1 MCE family protein [Planctomycetota bacterium]
MTNNTARRDFILGLVFFGTIALLLYYTIVLTGFSFSEKTYMKAWFPDARGLKEGDAILVAGRPSGTVREVVFDDERPSDRRIGVTMEFTQPPTLHEGYMMSIAEFTVLGGRVIEIEPGPGMAPVIRAGAELVGIVKPTALDSFSQLLEDNSEDFRAIVANLRTTTEDLAEGRGVIGALLHDEAMLTDVNAVIDDVTKMMEDLSAGRGTLGALLSDEDLRSQVVGIMEDTQVTVADIRSIGAAAKNGEGLLGALLQDPNLRNESLNLVHNLDDVAARLSKVVVDATEGKGLLGTIIADEEVASDAANFLADLSEVTRRLKDGEGSLGRLLAEEQAYDELLIALKSLNNQLEDAREAQPISTFTQLLFGTF